MRHLRKVPADWKNAELITIFTGDRQDCSNYYYRILLLSIHRNVHSHTAQQTINPSGGFSTLGIMWVLCKLRNHFQQIQEKCIEQNIALYMIFVNFINFDTEQGITMKHPMKTRVPRPFHQARIYLAYRNEAISQLKRRILGTI